MDIRPVNIKSLPVPPAVNLTTTNTVSTPMMYIGITGQSYLGYWAGNNEVFFNVVLPDNIWSIDIAGIRYFRVDGSLSPPQVQIGVVGTRVDTSLKSGELLLEDASLGLVGKYLSIGTQGVGVAPIFGLDNRSGVSSNDGAPITLYTATASEQVYRISAHVYVTAYTSGTIIYTLTWTEHATAKTKVTTGLTALDTEADLTALIKPDTGTAITGRLTGITTATVTLAATVERLA